MMQPATMMRSRIKASPTATRTRIRLNPQRAYSDDIRSIRWERYLGVVRRVSHPLTYIAYYSILASFSHVMSILKSTVRTAHALSTRVYSVLAFTDEA